MPAEWEPHEATWLAFPHNVADWPGRFGPIPWVYADIIKKVTVGEAVTVDPAFRLRGGESVAWQLRAPDPRRNSGPSVQIVHEDPHLLVIDKPPLVAVHPTARYHHHTVIKRLQAERPDEYVALIHRIDATKSQIRILNEIVDVLVPLKERLDGESGVDQLRPF